jgi:hypothetical protein
MSRQKATGPVTISRSNEAKPVARAVNILTVQKELVDRTPLTALLPGPLLRRSIGSPRARAFLALHPFALLRRRIFAFPARGLPVFGQIRLAIGGL